MHQGIESLLEKRLQRTGRRTCLAGFVHKEFTSTIPQYKDPVSLEVVNLTGNALIRTRKAPIFQNIAGLFPVLQKKPQAAKSQSSEMASRLGIQPPHSARESDSAPAHSFHDDFTQLVSLSLASSITDPGKSMQKRKQKLNHIDQFPFFTKIIQNHRRFLWGYMNIYSFISSIQEQ